MQKLAAKLELNEGWVHPQYAHSFKQHLGHAPHRTIAQLKGEPVSARMVAQRFMRELLFHVNEATEQRIRDLVITVPVESYDQYRAELAQLAHNVGINRVRFLDEPVAAAIGYGLGLKGERKALVVDFGGGTLDLALVKLSPRDIESGGVPSLPKQVAQSVEM